MNRLTRRRALPLLLLAAVALAAPLQALAQPTPLFETKKITDHVYLFRYGGHQSMFVVTPDGVIATDPIAQRRPEAATTYLAEIRRITQAPIKSVCTATTTTITSRAASPSRTRAPPSSRT